MGVYHLEVNSEGTCEELVRLLRLQRHDFLNHLQVVHGQLQMGRVEKALIYIENIAKDPRLLTDAVAANQCVDCAKAVRRHNGAACG